MSLLEALGNVADLPGSMVRDALSLRNPFDQFLSPFSQDNRTTGQDLLQALGVHGESPWLGFGAEMALDPMTYLGAGLIGKGAKGLGLASKLSGGASKLKSAFSTAKGATEAIRGIPSALKGTLAGARGSVTGPDKLERLLAATAYNQPFRQAAGGATLLHSLGLARDANNYQPELY